MIRLIFISLLITTSAKVFSEPEPSFYDQRQRGWFWHEPEPEPEIKPKEKSNPDSPLPPQESKSQSMPGQLQALNTQWLKDNLEVLMQKAIDNPTKENIAAYAYANRLLMDISTRFSVKMKEFGDLEVELQESNRRPMSSFALDEFHAERDKVVKSVMDDLKSKTHLWFFFSSTCPYCMKQIPVLQEFQARTGIPILAISIDGGTLPGLEQFKTVYDEGNRVSRMFNVRVTPTMHLVDNNQKKPLPLPEGLSDLPQLESRVLLASRQAGLITEDSYQLAKSVRDITVFKNKEGEIMVDKAKLESDPGYLADVLRQRLSEIESLKASTSVRAVLN